jgi:integrase
MNYSPRRDIPDFARQLRTLSSSAICQMVLNRRNEKRTPQSVTMWFKEHLDVKQQLEKEIIEGLPTEKEAVDSSIFQNGTFGTVPVVKEWILYMNTRRHNGKSLHPSYVQSHIRRLRFLCRKYQKHPARLMFHDAQEIFLDMENQGKDTFAARNVLKDFLKSKGSPEWEKIGVGKPRGFGKYRTLFLPKLIVMSMLEWTKGQNFKVYVVDEIMWHNGLRINVVLTAKIENFVSGEKWDYLTVTEKFRDIKTFKLVKEVGDLIRTVIGERKEGLIFQGLDDKLCAEINRDALKRYAPELKPKIRTPNHFYRHMCAQHLLLVTNRNSKAVAAIMKCSEQSLNESYGGATDSDVEAWENQFLPLIGRPVLIIPSGRKGVRSRCL